MLKNLKQNKMPTWLTCLTKEKVEKEEIPIKKILQGSQYFPCWRDYGSHVYSPDSREHEIPVMELLGNVHSIVCADYNIASGEMELTMNKLRQRFKGYNLFAERNLRRDEIIDYDTGKELLTEFAKKLSCSEKSKVEDIANQAARTVKTNRPGSERYASWCIFEREKKLDEQNGPERFSIMFFLEDGLECYIKYYVAQSVAPSAIALIQPGKLSEGNFNSFSEQNGAFYKAIKSNKAGMPEYLLYGGLNGENSFEKSCWEEYNKCVAKVEDPFVGNPENCNTKYYKVWKRGWVDNIKRIWKAVSIRW